MGRTTHLHSLSGPDSHAANLKPIYDALAIVTVSAVIITGTLIGGLWLLARTAAWIAHALPAH